MRHLAVLFVTTPVPEAYTVEAYVIPGRFCNGVTNPIYDPSFPLLLLLVDILVVSRDTDIQQSVHNHHPAVSNSAFAPAELLSNIPILILLIGQ
jgi:hypothetical protein